MGPYSLVNIMSILAFQRSVRILIVIKHDSEYSNSREGQGIWFSVCLSVKKIFGVTVNFSPSLTPLCPKETEIQSFHRVVLCLIGLPHS